jgi:serine/threonine protein kinase
MWKPRSGPRELQVGDLFGPYRLEEPLGEGAMGVVFRAIRNGETVALKVLRVELSQDDVYRKRFIREARSAGEVRHENLVPILDAGEVDGRHYLAFAFVPGETLEARIMRDGRLPRDDIVLIAAEIGGGLDSLHERGIVHRDVKVSNILLRDDGVALLTDFGLARGRAHTVLTKPGQVLGTLDYIAPELIKGKQATPASDIYGLGCSVYECVAGKTPFADKKALQVGLAHLEEKPPDPGLGRDDWSPELSSAVLQALEKDPASRPPTAGAYAEILRSAASGPAV